MSPMRILSTGNFNEITAQFYTDHVLMTTDPVIIKEMVPFLNFYKKNTCLGSWKNTGS